MIASMSGRYVDAATWSASTAAYVQTMTEQTPCEYLIGVALLLVTSPWWFPVAWFSEDWQPNKKDDKR